MQISEKCIFGVEIIYLHPNNIGLSVLLYLKFGVDVSSLGPLLCYKPNSPPTATRTFNLVCSNRRIGLSVLLLIKFGDDASSCHRRSGSAAALAVSRCSLALLGVKRPLTVTGARGRVID
jgi:hypothetical protein